MEKRELYHYGVKGMKWGVRKAQVKSAGRKLSKKLRLAGRVISKKAKQATSDISSKRKAKKAEEAKRERERYLTKTNVKKLTSDELVERARILALRKQALDVERNCKQVDREMVNKGKSVIKKLGSEMLMPAVISAGKDVLGDYFVKVGKDALGLKEVKSKTPEVKTWDDMLKKQQYESAKKGDLLPPVKTWDDVNKKLDYERKLKESQSDNKANEPEPNKNSESSNKSESNDWNVVTHTPATVERGQDYIKRLLDNEEEYLKSFRKK